MVIDAAGIECHQWLTEREPEQLSFQPAWWIGWLDPLLGKKLTLEL